MHNVNISKMFKDLSNTLQNFMFMGTTVFDSQVFRRKKVSHCYRSRCCYGEPTCIARLVQFAVVAVAIQPCFQHIQQLNEVTVHQTRLLWLSVQNGWDISKCVILLQQNVCIFTVVMKVGI